MVVLNRIEDLPIMMTITKLLSTTPHQPHPSPLGSTADSPDSAALKVHCLRLMELTQRTSAVMKVSEHHFDRLDPVINVFRTFGKLNDVLVTAEIAIVPDDGFVDSVQLQAVRSKSEMVIVPWSSGVKEATVGSAVHRDEFIRAVLETIESHVAVMIDATLPVDDSPPEPSLSRSISVTSLRNRVTKAAGSSEIEASPVVQLQKGYQIFLPYFGGRDDRVALKLVIQLLRCIDVTATIVRFRLTRDAADLSSTSAARIVPETSDNIKSTSVHKSTSPIASAMSSALTKFRFPDVLQTFPPSPELVQDDEELHADDAYVTSVVESVAPEIRPQIRLETIDTSTPLQYLVERLNREIQMNGNKHHLVIVGRATKYARTGNLARALRCDLLAMSGQSETLGKTALGDVGEALLFGQITGGFLVVQSAKDGDE